MYCIKTIKHGVQARRFACSSKLASYINIPYIFSISWPHSRYGVPKSTIYVSSFPSSSVPMSVSRRRNSCPHSRSFFPFIIRIHIYFAESLPARSPANSAPSTSASALASAASSAPSPSFALSLSRSRWLCS